MVTDDERRKVAARLREYASWDEDGELVGCTEFGEAVLNRLSCGDTERECFNALADLIDPTCEARRDTVFKPAVLYPDIESDDVGREETVYRCSGCGEIVSYDEDYEPETDLPAYCMRCGSRITGIGKPWDE